MGWCPMKLTRNCLLTAWAWAWAFGKYWTLVVQSTWAETACLLCHREVLNFGGLQSLIGASCYSIICRNSPLDQFSPWTICDDYSLGIERPYQVEFFCICAAEFQMFLLPARYANLGFENLVRVSFATTLAIVESSHFFGSQHEFGLRFDPNVKWRKSLPSSYFGNLFLMLFDSLQSVTWIRWKWDFGIGLLPANPFPR